MKQLSVIVSLSACGNDFTEGQIVVPDLNGAWSVSFVFGQSLDGSWTCSETSQAIFTISQTTDLFTGTTDGGEAACQSTDGLSETVSFDQYSIFNGLVDQAGNIVFNWSTLEQVLTGMVSEDRLSIQGIYDLSLLMPPGIAVFFSGTWTATKN